jgi:S1-C subfamily serine protease
MDKMILRHLSGSRANQVDELPLDENQEVLFGRDDAAKVKYDAQRDDLVSRQHAKIVRDPSDPSRFVVQDLSSRNGTFVNKQRISGSAVLQPGDVVQFGPGGPEFQFDLDPRPQTFAATREANVPVVAAPATRESSSSLAGVGAASGVSPAMSTDSAPVKTGIGKQTLEREIGRAKSESKKTLIFATAGVALLAVILIAAMALRNNSSEQRLSKELATTEGKLAETQEGIEKEKSERYLTVAEVAKKVTPSTVYIQTSWKLIDTDSGGIVYHQYLPIKTQNGTQRVPAYVLTSNGKYQPWLTMESSGNKAIGSSGGGSGFVVTDDGFILTNRHVAAAWFTPMDLPAGVVVKPGKNGLEVVGTVQTGPRNWVPANALDDENRQSLTGRALAGRSDYLEVTFPKEKTSTSARLIRVSNEHDVALIKIDLPGSVPALKLNSEKEEAQQGKPVTVVGYPFAGDLAPGVAAVRDVSGGLGAGKVVFIPEPTVTNGVIARVIEGGDNPLKYINVMGDVYQHTAGTNPGNSGGPVCDHRGNVIGVHFAGQKGVQGANFAVPIKYGIKLMGTDKVEMASDEDEPDDKEQADKTDADADKTGDKDADGSEEKTDNP